MSHDDLPIFGLAADEKEKEILKFDPNALEDGKEWVERILGINTGEDFFLALKDGVILCELANALRPGCVPTIHRNSKTQFKHMENINNYLKACRRMGLREEDLFMTVDLYEQKHLVPVLDNLLRLRARAPADKR
eukprot:TRINITY_DN19482_c0_g1_i1.p1 TRINITY_DN19482_c0_g1~~TRINITY_DN19482_c0_g1_i1.p1  ORF type:complete len:135 (-),score=28.83 TRINITY_DN19482_c0_g1_i1:15-419(-)